MQNLNEKLPFLVIVKWNDGSQDNVRTAGGFPTKTEAEHYASWVKAHRLGPKSSVSVALAETQLGLI